jgi:hypothetical protein
VEIFRCATKIKVSPSRKPSDYNRLPMQPNLNRPRATAT